MTHENTFKVTGRAINTWEDQYAAFLQLECEAGEKPRAVVVRVWRRDLRAIARAIEPGEIVAVTGQVNSRQGKTGDRWFTDVEAFELRRAGGEPKSAPPVNDDDVNF